MGYFCNTHKDPDDEEEDYLFKIRNYKYHYDTSGRNAYNHRFLNLRYLTNLQNEIYARDNSLPKHHRHYHSQNYNRQIVYKNIGVRSGRQALGLLARYLIRDLSHQSEQDKAILFDSNHNKIESDVCPDFLNSFASDFQYEQFKDENSYITDLFENKRQENIKLDELEFKIWRVGTKIKFKNNWNRDAVITEVHDNDYFKVNYHTKDGELADYVLKDNLIPTVTPENIRIFKHEKADKPDQMIIAYDDNQYSVHKKALYKIEKSIPTDFHHLMFSFGGDDYDKQIGHSAFRDFLDDSFKARGFDYIYTHHDDTNNPHYHVICKSQSSLNKEKSFPIGKEDSFIIRKELNYHLMRNGIDRSVIRNCDRIFAKEQSLNQKLQTPYYRDKADENDVQTFIQDVMHDYFTKNRDNMLSEHLNLLDDLEIGLKKFKNKDKWPAIFEKTVEKSKDTDPFLHELTILHLDKKQKITSKSRLAKNKERLLNNIENASADIEAHEYKLSDNQKMVKYAVSHIKRFLENDLGKNKTQSKQAEKSKILNRSDDSHDRGMGF